MKQQTKRLLKSLCMAVGVVLLSTVDPLAGYATERTIDIKHLGEGQSICPCGCASQVFVASGRGVLAGIQVIYDCR